MALRSIEGPNSSRSPLTGKFECIPAFDGIQTTSDDEAVDAVRLNPATVLYNNN